MTTNPDERPDLDADDAALALLQLAHAGTVVELALDGFAAFVVIAQLQLALRHPSNSGDEHHADLVRHVIDELARQLPAALRPVIERGYDPDHDERPACPHCGSADVDYGATGLDQCHDCDGLSRHGRPLRARRGRPLMPAPDAVVEDLTTCRVCGCTDLEGCPGGCWWVPDPEQAGEICSQCVELVQEGLAAL